MFANIIPQEQAVSTAFDMHIAEYALSFPTAAEYNFRMSLFAETDAFIEQENSNPSNTFELGHNKFSTWTKKEFEAINGSRNKAPQ